MIQKAMIMSAGVGSRLDPLTRDIPKPLVPIANIPVMDILLQHLANHGIKKVIANTHYLAEQIENRYTKSSPINIDFSYIYEQNLSGTAGGVKKCQFFFEEGETFIVMSADGLTDIDINEAAKSHKESGCIATIVTKTVDKNEVDKFGVIVVDSDNKIVEFQEKPPIEEAKSNLVNTGIYIFNYEIFNYIPENTTYDFAKNVFPDLMNKNIPINTYKTDRYWSDIGSISQYVESTKDILNKKIKIPNLIITSDEDKFCLACDTKAIDNSCKIVGNCTIGKNVKLSKNAVISNSIIWDDVEVADDVVIENSIITSGSKITKSVKNEII